MFGSIFLCYIIVLKIHWQVTTLLPPSISVFFHSITSLILLHQQSQQTLLGSPSHHHGRVLWGFTYFGHNLRHILYQEHEQRHSQRTCSDVLCPNNSFWPNDHLSSDNYFHQILFNMEALSKIDTSSITTFNIF